MSKKSTNEATKQEIRNLAKQIQEKEKAIAYKQNKLVEERDQFGSLNITVDQDKQDLEEMLSHEIAQRRTELDANNAKLENIRKFKADKESLKEYNSQLK